MGNFRIIIDAVGGHGQDRSKKEGEVVNFYASGNNTPDALAKTLVEVFKYTNAGDVKEAKIIHWPGESGEVTDDLKTGIRKGDF